MLHMIVQANSMAVSNIKTVFLGSQDCDESELQVIHVFTYFAYFSPVTALKGLHSKPTETHETSSGQPKTAVNRVVVF